MSNAENFIAHPGKGGSKDQSVKKHLQEVAELARGFAEKIGRSQRKKYWSQPNVVVMG